MDLAQDIACIAAQEERLVFPQFDQATAWELGTRLQQLATARGVAVTIEIRLQRETVFLHAMPGTTPVNADWARRKPLIHALRPFKARAKGFTLRASQQALRAATDS